MRMVLTAIAVGPLPASATNAATAPVMIVAAQSHYGELALAIGGDRVGVVAVNVAPGADPHDFEPPPSVAVAVAEATVVIVNGAGYDQWIERLLDASGGDRRAVINVAELVGYSAGDNPHVWYDPRAMPAAAHALASVLIELDPEGAPAYEARRDAFLETLAPIEARIREIHARFAGTPVAATEPAFGYMAAALGLNMLNEDFQSAIMNEMEPAARDVASFVDGLRAVRIKVLFYNSQVEDGFTRTLANAAEGAGVPVVALTETQPRGTTFAAWMLGQINAAAKALEASAR